ncbi:hypothetical protein GQ53DRAFT_824490 [Thozetella sp. PMI_491]|nr:hypothetical protein GQ53DRAFT_824490 [Thozetella sp. PMI_491]
MAPFTRKDTTEYKRLAADDDLSDRFSDIEASTVPSSPRRYWPSWKQLVGITVVQILLFSAYTYTLFRIFPLGASCSRGPQDVVASPASSVIRWELQILDTRVVQQNRFNAEPSDEVDEAWAELIYLSNVKVSAEDVRAINKTSIEIPTDPGMVWATLGVNHELHCLDRLRQAIHPDFYFPDWTPEERKRNQMHSRHCIDYLRQAAMCHGDLSLTTYYWAEDSAIPIADFDTPHACVNWDAIQKWEEERVFRPLTPGLLMHPKFGAAFPEGEGDKIGVLPDHHS